MVEPENASSEITLHYAVTRKHIAEYHWHMWKRRLWIFHLIVLGAGGLCWWLALQKGERGSYIYLIICVLAIAFMLIYPQLRYKPQARELILGESGLQTTIGSKSGRYTWEDIGRIDVAGDDILIFNKNMNAFIIPPHAFASAEQRQAVLDQIREWHAKAGIKSAP